LLVYLEIDSENIIYRAKGILVEEVYASLLGNHHAGPKMKGALGLLI